MEQYHLLPLVVAAIALIGGMFTGIRLHRHSWAPKAKPYALGLLLLAIIFGTVVSGWLTGVFMHVVGSHWTAAMLSVSLLSFSTGVIFALCSDAKKSNRENNTNSAGGDK
ncbi:MAG: hypothetical protein IT342_26465 [Candidatus Melainabacteria bacterium]|nr:hypothetical protein [Candidatus Melainabacteria bacterium]